MEQVFRSVDISTNGIYFISLVITILEKSIFIFK